MKPDPHDVLGPIHRASVAADTEETKQEQPLEKARATNSTLMNEILGQNGILGTKNDSPSQQSTTDIYGRMYPKNKSPSTG